MSDQLRRHPDDLGALVAQTASARTLPAPYVEKDFWVTEVLRVAAVDREAVMPDGSTSPVTFLFKGGTSLSRVFGIVDRFSEDVDLLAIFPDGATPNARHKVLKRVDADVTAHLGLTQDNGGPTFLAGTNTVVGLTITGDLDTGCLATSVAYRLDTPAARAFLATPAIASLLQ